MRIDIGSGYSYEFWSWSPDRELNPQYAGVPDVDKAGVILYYNEEPIGSVQFDTPEVRAVPGLPQVFWTLHSLDPLHIEPSIQTYDTEGKPNHHGWIRNGKWEGA